MASIRSTATRPRAPTHAGVLPIHDRGGHLIFSTLCVRNLPQVKLYVKRQTDSKRVETYRASGNGVERENQRFGEPEAFSRRVSLAEKVRAGRGDDAEWTSLRRIFIMLASLHSHLTELTQI
jgi:hypothetical protein